MKKRILFAVSFVVLISCLFAFAVPVQAAGEPELSITPIQCKEGEYVEVFVNLKNAAGLSGILSTIKYDMEQLEFLYSEQPKESAQAGLIVVAELNSAKTGIGFGVMQTSGVEDKYQELDLVRLVFKANKDGVSEIELVLNELEYNMSEKFEDKLGEIKADVVVSADVDSLNVVDPSVTQAAVSDEEILDTDKSNKTIIIIGIIVVAIIGGVVIYSLVSKKKSPSNAVKVDTNKDK